MCVVLLAARAMELRRLEDGADDVQESVSMDPEIRAYYESGVERERLAGGTSRIEYERTKDLLGRHLPPSPARVLDVGGGPGVYAEGLRARGDAAGPPRPAAPR